MTSPIRHPGEPAADPVRDAVVRFEPRSLRTFTPTQAVLSHSAGVYHWTPDGRRLYDFTSGVLVSNLGHNPSSWMKAYTRYMQWPEADSAARGFAGALPKGYFAALPMTAY